MFKPAPNTCGTTAALLDSISNVVLVDSATYTYLAGIIAGGHHTYIVLGTLPTLEYVQVQGVTGTPGELILGRNFDGSGNRAHPSGTDIRYVLTAAAVQDIVNASMGLSVVIEAEYPLIVGVVATNHFQLSLDPLAMTSSNGTLIVTGQWPTIDLATNPASNGCCT